MDDIRKAFWESFRGLFPPHAKAVQTATGGLTISWPTTGNPDAHFAHSMPIAIRFEADLLEAMGAAGFEQRSKIAQRHEAALKAGLIGYEPYASVPKSRVIVLG
ncbi:MAG: hypothetical protein ABIU58_02770 [Ramlibacter sp.]